MLASKGADGIIFLGQGAGDKWLRDLARTNAPFVVWGAVDENGPYCAVGSDNERGGMLAGQRFAQLGRKNILFVANRAHPEMEHRRRGLTSSLTTGMTVSDLEIPDFTYETGYSAMQDYLRKTGQPADAVFAASDTIAMAMVTALRDVQLAVPADVSVIGYNDMPIAAHFFPPLTTIRQDTQEAGSLLVEKLFQILDGAKPKSAKLPTELVVRQT